MLRQCLGCALAQEYDDYEVMVVLAAGENDNISLLKRMEMEHLNLRHLVTPQEARFIPYEQLSLSLGIMEARYDWVALTQSDCTMPRNWLSAMSSGMNGGHSIVAGPADYSDSSFNRVWRQLTALAVAGRCGFLYRADGCNTALRKSAFLQSGGFGSSVTLKHGALQIWANAHGGAAAVGSADACVMQSRNKANGYEAIQWLESRRHLAHKWRYRLALLSDYLTHALAFTAFVSLMVTLYLFHSQINAFFDTRLANVFGVGTDCYVYAFASISLLLYIAFAVIDTKRFNKKARLYYGRAYGVSVCLMKLLFPISWFSNLVDYLFMRRKKFFKTGL